MEWAVPCAFLLLLAACGSNGKNEKPRPVPSQHGAFTLSLDSTQQVVDSVFADLNSDGVDECIITVGARTDDPAAPKMYSLVHVFEFSKRDSAWRSIFVDAVESGAVVYFRDVTGSGSPEIIAGTDAGGNDPIASQGMHVYGFRADNVFTLLFYSPSGKPEFTDLNSDGVEEIIVLAQYWGVSSRAEAFVYTAGVYGFNGDAYKDANAEYAGYYKRVIVEKRRVFGRAKKTPEDQAGLYRAAMDVMLWHAASGDVTSVTQFWNAERSSLAAALPEELYDELEYFADMEKTGYTQPLAGRQS